MENSIPLKTFILIYFIQFIWSTALYCLDIQLINNETIVWIVLQVFIRIDEALTSADDPEILTSILLETGAYHKKIPGFKPEMFWVR